MPDDLTSLNGFRAAQTLALYPSMPFQVGQIPGFSQTVLPSSAEPWNGGNSLLGGLFDLGRDVNPTPPDFDWASFFDPNRGDAADGQSSSNRQSAVISSPEGDWNTDSGQNNVSGPGADTVSRNRKTPVETPQPQVKALAKDGLLVDPTTGHLSTYTTAPPAPLLIRDTSFEPMPPPTLRERITQAVKKYLGNGNGAGAIANAGTDYLYSASDLASAVNSAPGAILSFANSAYKDPLGTLGKGIESLRAGYRNLMSDGPEGEAARGHLLFGLASGAAGRVNGAVHAAEMAAAEKIPLIGGRPPINSSYAGGMHPAGVKFTGKGFPDFGPDAITKVKLQGLTGDLRKDAQMANNAMGFEGTPKGYVWHHVEDGKTMQLVPDWIHKLVGHTGGRATIENGGFD